MDLHKVKIHSGARHIRTIEVYSRNTAFPSTEEVKGALYLLGYDDLDKPGVGYESLEHVAADNNDAYKAYKEQEEAYKEYIEDKQKEEEKEAEKDRKESKDDDSSSFGFCSICKCIWKILKCFC